MYKASVLCVSCDTLTDYDWLRGRPYEEQENSLWSDSVIVMSFIASGTIFAKHAMLNGFRWMPEHIMRHIQ